MRQPRMLPFVSRCCVIALACVVGSCGDRPAPTSVGPSSFSSFLAPQIDGVWGGPMTLVEVGTGAGTARNVSEASCVVDRYRTVVGETLEQTFAITQTGTDLRATVASTRTGVSCTFTGLLGTSSASLTSPACGAASVNMLCGGASYVLQPVGATMTLTLDAPVQVTTMAGTVSYSYNVALVTPEGAVPSGTLISSHRLTAVTRR